MEHLNASADLAIKHLRKHGIPPVERLSMAPDWMRPVFECMQKGMLGSGTIDHTEVLTKGYLPVVMAAACRVTDNVAAVEFAAWATDDVIAQYLRLCDVRGRLKEAPGSFGERVTAIVRQAASAICSTPGYPDILTRCVVPFLGNRSKFRVATNAHSTKLYPPEFDCGLPSAQLLPVGALPEEFDIPDRVPQFQYFFPGCRGSLRKGFSLETRMLEVMQNLAMNAGLESEMFDALQKLGSYAPRPKHDYTTPGEYIMASMMGIGNFNACLFAKVRYAPPMIFPDWDSWSIHFGTDDEAGNARTGLPALLTIMQMPAELPARPKQELELWRQDEFPYWVAYQASWSARRGVPVSARHFRALSLEQYLPPE